MKQVNEKQQHIAEQIEHNQKLQKKIVLDDLVQSYQKNKEQQKLMEEIEQKQRRKRSDMLAEMTQ